MVASRLASLCVAWTIALACLKYLAVPLFSHPTIAAAATTAAREQCLDTVVREMLLRVDAKLSAPRQAALLFLAELVLRERVRGDFLEYGSADGGTAALLFAVMMCDGDAGRRLWTFGDWRDELQRWAAVWQPRPGLAWDSARLLRLAPPAQPGRVALLVCGGPTYRDTESCLRHAPAVTRGGIVFVSEYWKHDGSRSAADSSRGAYLGGAPATPPALVEEDNSMAATMVRRGVPAVAALVGLCLIIVFIRRLLIKRGRAYRGALRV